MDHLKKYRCQNRKERPKRSTNNGDMAEIAKPPVSDGETELVCDIYLITEELLLCGLFLLKN